MTQAGFLSVLLLVLPRAAAADAPAAATREAVVRVSVENLYSAPDESKDVVSQATLGQLVGVLATSGAFARVRTPDAYEGWLPRAALVDYPDGQDPRYAQHGRVVEVTSLMANLYRDPDVTSARPTLLAPLATRLEVRGDGPSPHWLALRLPAGNSGYIQRGDVREVDPTAARRRGTPREIVATARRFLGVPYLWGGMTAHGIDCSGLASRVYHANGVDLPRDADLQFDDPRSLKVARRALQPGDLLFFGKDSSHITHVGLYLGGGRFMSATTHEAPMVREDSLADPHWSAIYQGARRPR